jgi:hypothetical protein
MSMSMQPVRSLHVHNVRVQQNELISTLKDRSGLTRILLQRLVALVRRAALSVSSCGG